MPASVFAASAIVSDLWTPHTASCHSPAGTFHAREITEPTVSFRPDHRLGYVSDDGRFQFTRSESNPLPHCISLVPRIANKILTKFECIKIIDIIKINRSLILVIASLVCPISLPPQTSDRRVWTACRWSAGSCAHHQTGRGSSAPPKTPLPPPKGSPPRKPERHRRAQSSSIWKNGING